MRVFVLGTGRCGTTTLIEACSHLTNFTADHETHQDAHPDHHLDYPDQHIEADNRLSWFLGPLHERYPDARYVHLTRDVDGVVGSYLKRWPADPRQVDPKKQPVLWARTKLRPQWNPGTRAGNGIIGAFAYPIMARRSPWPEAERIDVVRYYVSTVTANIDHFLRDKPHIHIRMEEMRAGVTELVDWIGGEGDLERIYAEGDVRHNATGNRSPRKAKA